jgi:hypothetical protein
VPAARARLLLAMMKDGAAHRVVLLRDIETLDGGEQEW